jgi:hypothetical protein
MGTNTAVIAVAEPTMPLDHITQDLTEAVQALSRYVRDDTEAATQYGGRAIFLVSLVLAVVLALLAPAYFDRSADRPAAANLAKTGKTSRVLPVTPAGAVRP